MIRPMPRTSRSGLRPVWEGLVVAAAYVVSGWLGLQAASVGHTVTLLWPPSGIALAAITRRGVRLSWAVLLGAVLTNVAVGGSPTEALLIGLGNTSGAVLGATFLRRFDFAPTFSRRRDVALLAAGAILSASLAGLLGSTVATTWHGEGTRSFASVFAIWSVGDFLGMMLVAPPLLVWSVPSPELDGRPPLVALLTLLASTLLMLGAPFRGPEALPLTLVPLLLLVWVALRGGARWTAPACLLVCVIVAVGTQLGFGPFAGSEPTRMLPILGMFLGLSALMTSILTALTAETRRAELALEESAARFRGAFEHAPFGMMLLEPDGTISEANVRVGSILQEDAASLVGRSIGEFAVSEDRAKLMRRVRDYAASADAESTSEIECSFRRADGDNRLLRARLGRAPHVGKTADSFVMQVEDVTSWRRAEAERAALALQLAQAQRLDSIGQLAGGVAHDFNNVLQAIGASLELLALPERSPAQREALLTTASNAVDRAASLVRQLLDFSRRDPGEHRVFDLRDLVSSTLGMLTRLLPANVRVTTRFEARPCLVSADWTQMDQLVLNLCLNARDAIDGPGNIEVSLECVGRESSAIRLEVVDDGAGIPEGIRDRVFEPFFTTKEPGKGTGLGLSVVYGIVQRHRGKISISSARPGGTGTRVSIELPAAEAVAAVAPVTAKAPAATGGHEKILLAEDDPHVREAMSGLLREAGYRVLVAHDGLEAVELFEAEKGSLDGVVLDVVMPRMGGREALEHIRARAPQIPALLCTGYDPSAVAGADVPEVVVLRKPCPKDQLLATLRSVLDLGHPGASPEAYLPN